ncbi:MAG: hypothetical protein ACOCXO_04395, partial [Bacteroidota bacterium]
AFMNEKRLPGCLLREFFYGIALGALSASGFYLSNRGMGFTALAMILLRRLCQSSSACMPQLLRIFLPAGRAQ